MSKNEELVRLCMEHGAFKAGVADLAAFKSEDCTIPENLLEPYTMAVSIAVDLDDEVMDGIDNRPTKEYAQLYRKTNETLDVAAAVATAWIEGKGYAAKAIPASKIMDEDRLMGSISHKAVARMAGLGWQGKSLLLITPERGPRVRLVTVLTDMPLEPGAPVENRCGDCSECFEACPVGSIKGLSTKDRYAKREHAISIKACHGRTKESLETPELGALICGVCVRACPWGKKGAEAPS